MPRRPRPIRAAVANRRRPRPAGAATTAFTLALALAAAAAAPAGEPPVAAAADPAGDGGGGGDTGGGGHRGGGEVRTVSRVIPLPTTVSAEARAVLGGPASPWAERRPATTTAWRTLIAEIEAATRTGLLQPTLARYPVDIRAETIAGVPVRIVTPRAPIPAGNRERLLVNLHGGGYIVNAGDNAVLEAIPLAHLMRIAVVAVDYRMPPDHPFPAALDDAGAVLRAVLATRRSSQVGLYGTSAGGALAAATVAAAARRGEPLPAAVAMIAPWADLGPVGDSLAVNAGIDPTLVGYDGLLAAAARLYAGDTDLADPRLSPVYAPVAPGHPPALLLSGSRDLLLSGTLRLHRRLVEAGVAAELHVFEAMWHDFPVSPAVPEAQAAWRQVARFFDAHLGP